MTATSWDPEPDHLAKLLLNFWLTEIIEDNVYYIEPLSFGVICYTVRETNIDFGS